MEDCKSPDITEATAARNISAIVQNSQQSCGVVQNKWREGRVVQNNGTNIRISAELYGLTGHVVVQNRRSALYRLGGAS